MKLSDINPLAKSGVVKDVDVELARSGEFYRRAESFPERTVTTVLALEPSRRNAAREAKRAAQRNYRRARREAIRERWAAVRDVPRLSERQRRLAART